MLLPKVQVIHVCYGHHKRGLKYRGEKQRQRAMHAAHLKIQFPKAMRQGREEHARLPCLLYTGPEPGGGGEDELGGRRGCGWGRDVWSLRPRSLISSSGETCLVVIRSYNVVS